MPRFLVLGRPHRVRSLSAALPPLALDRAQRIARRGANVLFACTLSAVAACGAASSGGASDAGAGGGADTGAGGATSGGGGTGAGIGGKSATTYTCDSFPMSELLAAVQTVAPLTTAGHVVADAVANEFGSALGCSYFFAANLEPGVDPTTLKGQNVTFIVQIRDESVSGMPPPQTVRDTFAKNRDHTKNTASGDASSDIQFSFLPVKGVGDDAYFDDYITRQNGIENAEACELFVLRATLPMTVSVDMNYGQPDSSIPAPAYASDPFQNDMRHAMVVAFAKVVLSKM